jgi:MOSC domain-containing protein YiiM
LTSPTNLTGFAGLTSRTDPRLVSVNVGRGRDADWAGQLRRSAIDKRPVEGAAIARRLGLDGDEQVNRKHHGGVDQAVYAYAAEDAQFWERELRRPMWPGATGENLTTVAVDVTHAVIGERWRVGGAELEVSAPRTPCRTFAGFWDVPDLQKRFTAACRPGAYLRVVAEGPLAAGDAVEVVGRPEHGVTIETVFLARHFDRTLVPHLLGVPELASDLREWAQKILARTP